MLGNIFVRRVTGDIVVLPPLRNDNWVIIELISIVGQINKLKCISLLKNKPYCPIFLQTSQNIH